MSKPQKTTGGWPRIRESRAREEAEKHTRTGFLPVPSGDTALWVFLPETQHFVGAGQNSERRRTCTCCGDAAGWQHASKGDTIHTAPAIVTIATRNLPNAVSLFRFPSPFRFPLQFGRTHPCGFELGASRGPVPVVALR